jgi:hypothetical protein
MVAGQRGKWMGKGQRGELAQAAQSLVHNARVTPVALVERLGACLALGSLLDELRRACGGYEIIGHWQQGEFHHDVLLRLLGPREGVPVSLILVVATSCNGGVKEVLCFSELPARGALWHHRCPESPEFSGTLPPLLGSARTVHWVEPTTLLGPDARSEFRPEFRERQPGGGWLPKVNGANGVNGVSAGCGPGVAERSPG